MRRGIITILAALPLLLASAGCATAPANPHVEYAAKREELQARRAARDGNYARAAHHQRNAERLREEAIEEEKLPPAPVPSPELAPSPAPMPVPVPSPVP